jgi:hypothetical protein
MSDEPKGARRKWLSRLLAALIILASYEAVHYATVRYDWSTSEDDLGRLVRRVHEQHWIASKPVPQWLESLLRPASRIDDVLGNYPFPPMR